MSNPQKVVLDREKLLQQVKDLPSIARTKNWTYDYDDDLDELTYGLVEMPNNVFLFKLNDEINLYLSPDSTVNGIFIEYFKNNFIEHNKELKSVLKALRGSDEVKNEEAKVVLQQELMSDALKTIFNSKSLVTAI